MKAQTRGTLEMISAMLISGTVGWFVVMSGQSPEAVVFWRCVFGAMAMLVACLVLGVLRRSVISLRQFMLVCLGGLALILNWVLLFSAYKHSSIAVATVVYHVQPFMLVGLGVVFFAERLSAAKVCWLLLAFAGLMLIVSAKGNGQATGADYVLGVCLALASAFFYAVAAAITKRLKDLPAHLIVLIQMVVGALVLAPFVDVGTVDTVEGAWTYLIIIGVVHTGLMSTLLYSAIQKIPTALVGALSFIYPIMAILVDWVAFAHPLSVLQVIGASAILLAAAGMNFGWSLGRAPRQEVT
ncbi:EamA domain-containing membrane protein RarD [Pseudomonas synxantha]|uniref:Multidrug DMT transporter permease n=1 Tax=Pseudomonas synxantha TaxID=47883 RepID=A0AAX3I6V9_9PSED|nr:DMT family transporter [Pseudomonas synxantha]AZE67035.1 Permease of the drug/metabolite transporter (DMT) superfamily [Pseudomonas synxantha]KRP56061.1 multidrug DMT transporter permease [Pseudomonas synxantha]SDU31228.1 EamA domain-containing membrane protein RarD [Pseudomonas synxantha]VTQ99736.1 multidrug DMT transporter permease [Pseudomonas synxantha]